MDKELKNLLLSLGVAEDAIKEKEDDLSKFEDAEGLKRNRDDLIAENRKLKSKTSEQAAEEIEKLAKENQDLGAKLKDLSKVSKDYEKLQLELKSKSDQLQQMSLDGAINELVGSMGLINNNVTKNHLKSMIKFNEKGELLYNGKADIDEFKTEFINSEESKMLISASNLPNDTPISKPDARPLETLINREPCAFVPDYN